MTIDKMDIDIEEGEIVETTSKNDSRSRGAFPYSQPPAPALSCGSLLLQINQIRRQMRRVPKQRRRRSGRGASNHAGPRPPISPLSCRSLTLQIEQIRRQQDRAHERRDDSLGSGGAQPYTGELNAVSDSEMDAETGDKTGIDIEPAAPVPESNGELDSTVGDFHTALDEMIETESGKTDLLLLTPKDSGLLSSCDPFIQELCKGAKEICFRPRTVRPRAWDYFDGPANGSGAPSPINTQAAGLEKGQHDDTLPVQEVSISWRPGWQSMPLPPQQDGEVLT